MGQEKKRAQRYFELTREKGRIEKEVKALNTEFKTEMTNNKLTNMVEDGYELTLSQQDKSTVDNDKLVALLKKKRLTKKAVKKVQVPDEAVVEQLVADGVITPQEFATCINPKFNQVLTIKEVKKNG